MIKAILVPATGSSSDTAVFASALAVAHKFAGHIDFLHVRVDATAMAATMATDGGGAVMISGLVDRIDDEANQREANARGLFQTFCEREQLSIADTPGGRPGPTARWLREVGDEAHWVAEYARSSDLVVVGRRPVVRGFRSIRSRPLSSTAAGRCWYRPPPRSPPFPRRS